MKCVSTYEQTSALFTVDWIGADGTFADYVELFRHLHVLLRKVSASDALLVLHQ